MLIRPIKYPEESDLGFLLRTAQANGLANPKWLGAAIVGQHQRLRVCPMCLDEPYPYWHDSWHSDPPICRKHRRWLSDTCNTCLKPFSFVTCRFLACKCGNAYQRHSNGPVSCLVWNTLYSEKVNSDILIWLGSLAKYGLQGKPGKRASSRRIQEIAEFMELGSHAVAHWPLGFHTLLAHIRVVKGGTSVALASGAFPAFAKRIRAIRDTGWRSKIEGEFLAYITSTQVQDNALLSRKVRCTTNAKSIASKHQISVDRLKRLAAQGVVRVTPDGRQRHVIAPVIEERIAAQLADAVSIKHATRMLGLHPARVRALLAMKEVAPLDRGVSLKSIQAFEERMLALGTADNMQPEQPTSLNSAFKYLVSRSLTADFVRAIKNREISLSCSSERDSRALGDQLQVCTTQVLEWLTSLRKTNFAAALKLDISSAAKLLHVKPEVIKSLVFNGFLTPVEKQRKSRAPQYFLRNEIERFQESFISLRSLAAAANIPAKQAPVWARKNGYEIVTGPTVDGCRQYFVRRFRRQSA